MSAKVDTKICGSSPPGTSGRARTTTRGVAASCTSTNQTLTECIVAGDRAAAARFLLDHAPLVRARIRRRLGRRGRSMAGTDDLISTVLRRFDVAVSLHRIRGESEAQLVAYLLTVVDNAVAGVCRRAHVRRAEQPGLDDLRQSPSKMPDQTSVPAFAWRERLFLPLEDRLLVRLVISGLHSEVIADILGVSAATVRKRWQRIRQRTIVELRAANADRDESSRASNQGILRNR